jgi:FAD/FMN-containing dehydrogenase
LNQAVGGRLRTLTSPFEACRADPTGPACQALFKAIRNPFYNSDHPELTQNLGYVGAWTSAVSPYAVAAESAADVKAAVDFARRKRLRLAIKGGGHSYQGTSNAADSLLIWTHPMREITLHDGFVAKGCAADPTPAVTLGAGCRWIDAYTAVTTKGGRYVQGGGCTTVGVAGFVQGGGFGSFSKGYGTGAGSLLEAEVVTADGQVRIANASTNPELFWALKGGAGGNFGVVTKLTVRTHTLPKLFGVVNFDVKAKSPGALRRLIAETMAFARDNLITPHWGEQIGFSQSRGMEVRILSQGLERAEVQAIWQPFVDRLKSRPDDYTVGAPLILAIPAQRFWDPTLMGALPGVLNRDERPGADPSAFWWTGDGGQSGSVLHAYASTWLSKDLLAPGSFDRLVQGLYAAASTWRIELHFNKGLAGAPPEAIARARDTAMNPAVLDAFALVILGAGQGPAYPGIAGHEPDLDDARSSAAQVKAAADILRGLQARPASYVSESDYFEERWSEAFWGDNYPRLLRAKAIYDPHNLFNTHHGPGSGV